MSINRQITPRRGSPRATVPRSAPGPAGAWPGGRGQVAGRSRFLFLAIVVVLALGLVGAGGSAASLASSQVAAPAPGAAALGGIGQAAPTSGTVASVPGQGAVEAPRVLAKAVILADEATGQVLFERDAGAARAMASTTKVMTALLALERLDERKVVTIGAGPPQVGEESLRLQKGERLTVRQLLLGLLLKSANDAGVALAEAVDGSEAAFVRRMNRKATALRLTRDPLRDPLRTGPSRAPDQRSRPGPPVGGGHAPGRLPLAGRHQVRSNLRCDRCRFVDLSPRTSCSAPTGGRSGARPASPTGPDAAWSPRPAAVAAAWSRSRSGPPTPSPTSRRCSNTASPSSSGSAWPSRGQPVSAGPGRPAELQTTTAADALVRLDQLDQVRLTLPPGRRAEPGARRPCSRAGSGGWSG